MRLTGFQITKYRNIIDSGWVEVGNIASIVGQNECGKSNLLQALYKFSPYDDVSYNFEFDWPIDEWGSRDQNQIVCEAEFELTPSEVKQLCDAAVIESDDETEDSDAEIANSEAPAPQELPESVTVKVSRNYNEEYAVTLPSNFPDFLSREGAADWVEKNLPKCVYMDDYLSFRGYHRNLPQLAQKKNKPAELTEDEKTILIVFHLAALDIDDIVAKAGGGETQRAFDTNAASGHLSRQFKDKWKQKRVRFDLRVDGTNLDIFVEDEGLDAFVPLESRSRGFQWYVSFVWRFTLASRGEFENCILLLDEPGIHLHHAGHADLLEYFETLAETNSVIYTTHLATLLDLGYPERIRIMEVQGHHSSVNAGLISSQPEPMMVIEAALGLAGGMSGLLGVRQNLIVEGGEDALIIHKLSGLLRNSGEEGLSDRIYLLPARSASKTPMFAGFMVGNEWDAGVLLDSDAAGLEARKKITEMYLDKLSAESNSKFRVLMMKDATGITQNECAIEDLFPVDFYLECVNEAYGSNLIPDDLPTDGSDQLCKRVEFALKQRGRISKELDKKLVTGSLLKRFDAMQKIDDLPNGTADKAKELINKINGVFSEK